MNATSVAPGPLTLAFVVIGAALAATVIGWLAGRARQGRAVTIGAIAFVVLGGGGLWAVSAPRKAGPVETAGPEPAPVAASTPFVASKAAGGKLDAVRKAPSVSVDDFMMLWTIPAGDREDFCVRRMKHLAPDCRDAAEGMKDMAAPTLPAEIRTRLANAVKNDLNNRSTTDVAEEAIGLAKPGHPDEMLSFPSPGGTNADVYWCTGGDDGARYQRAFQAALGISSRAGLRLPGNVIMGRVRVIRTDRKIAGDVFDGDVQSPAVQEMLSLVRPRGIDFAPRPGAAAGGPVAFYVCR